MAPSGPARFAALKIGSGVPEVDFDGTVHSAFENALILAVNGRGLVTLVPGAAGGLPGGITLDADGGIGFDRMIAAGARAAARAGILRIGESGLAVDLRPAEAWRSRLHELSLDLKCASSRRAWAAAATVLAADGRAERFLRIAGEPISALIGATRGFSGAEVRAVLERLVGLGEGGTPAGDDFLVGFIAALHASVCGDGQRRACVEAFSRHLCDVADRTNQVSRVYLEAAAMGEVSEKLAKVAIAIARGAAPREVEEAATAAIAVGHTSGADGTLGLLAGMAAWGPDAVVTASGLLAAGRPIAAA